MPLAAYFQFVLGADPLKLARLGRCNGVEDGGYEWPQVLHPVGCGAHEDDPVGKAPECCAGIRHRGPS